MTRPLFNSIFVVAGLTLTANLLGMAREILIGRTLGASAATDAFFSAFTVVAVCFLVFTSGTLQSAFMPRYQALREAGQDGRAAALALRVGLWLGAVLFAAMAGLMAGAPALARLAVPGFAPPVLELTADLIRVLSPLVPILGLAALLQAVLNAHYRFALPAAGPVASNVVVIGALLALAPAAGIWALAGGTLAGGGLWLLLLLPAGLAAAGRPRADGGAELSGVMRNMAPLVVIMLADQLSAVVQKGLASGFEPGAISALHYGARLAGLPIGILGMALSTVLFPAMVSALQGGRLAEAGERAALGLAATAMLIMPAGVFFLMESRLFVGVLLERGAFGPEATANTALALAWYAGALVPQAAIIFLSRLFYAAERSAAVMALSLATSLLQIALCWVGVAAMGWPGIAASTSVYAVIHAAALLAMSRRIVALDWRALGGACLRIGAASAALALALLAPLPLTGAAALAAKLAAGGAAYAGVLLLLREPTLTALLRLRA
ncbi:MAG TPA: murein biosynthesis integral membrane protein MurJ [Alphaproteobacteria bacterium]|nr:murein biosynthesis integral membrane protein MurJ [Alphaproteobacteria bacterium]